MRGQTLKDRLDLIHRSLARIMGAISLSLTTRRVRRESIEDWKRTLREVLEEMERIEL